MTLAPSDNRNVRSVAAERYPLNNICSHPECDAEAVDPHHVWRRTAIGGDSWFVEIDGKDVIPHVTGLCRKHHSDVTVHRAWIKLEGEEFRWYRRDLLTYEDERMNEVMWRDLGPLSPQPGSRESKPKRKKREHKPAAERKKAVYSTRIPRDALEDGHEVLTSLIQAHRERLSPVMSWSDTVPDYFVLTAALAEGLQ